MKITIYPHAKQLEPFNDFFKCLGSIFYYCYRSDKKECPDNSIFDLLTTWKIRVKTEKLLII